MWTRLWFSSSSGKSVCLNSSRSSAISLLHTDVDAALVLFLLGEISLFEQQQIVGHGCSNCR